MQFARATALFWAAAAAQSVPGADADDGQSPRRLLMMDDFDFNNGFNNDFNNNIYQDDLSLDLDLPNLDGGYIPPPDDTPSCKYPAPSPPLPCGTGAYEGWYASTRTKASGPMGGSMASTRPKACGRINGPTQSGKRSRGGARTTIASTTV